MLHGVPSRELKGLADELKTEVESGVISIVATYDQKASLVVGVTDDLRGEFNAIDLVREGVVALGGKGGGGRWDMAQAGGPDVNDPEKALEKIKRAIADTC